MSMSTVGEGRCRWDFIESRGGLLPRNDTLTNWRDIDKALSEVEGQPLRQYNYVYQSRARIWLLGHTKRFPFEPIPRQSYDGISYGGFQYWDVEPMIEDLQKYTYRMSGKQQ